MPIKEILHISKENWLNERTKLGQIQEKSTYGPSFTVEGSQRFFIKIAGPAENDVEFNLKMDSEAKIDAESDGAHHSLKKKVPKGPRRSFWPLTSVTSGKSTSSTYYHLITSTWLGGCQKY